MILKYFDTFLQFSILYFSAPGETAEIAEEMAALDALKKLFRFDETSSKPLPFGRDLNNINIEKNEAEKPSLNEWKSSNIHVV